MISSMPSERFDKTKGGSAAVYVRNGIPFQPRQATVIFVTETYYAHRAILDSLFNNPISHVQHNI